MRRRRLVQWVATALLAGAMAAPAHAFDTSPHFDVTRDALQAEGFGNKAIQIAQINNWFVDFYENADSVPYSGHSGALVRLLGLAIFTENWDSRVVKAADRSHFDQTDGGFSNTAAISAEWDRLRTTTGALAREARSQNDPKQLLTVLGISLHQVQDFYSHTNWVEPGGVPGARGPDWVAKGFGRTPTWFDIPKAVRDGENIYSAGSIGVGRDHGSWKADGNTSLTRSMAKDWPGRPLYTEAHLGAYFATRQWVQAVRAWVGDDAFWQRAMQQGGTGELASDQKGMLNISAASGHWQGQGEACRPSFSTLSCGARDGPGGNLLDLRGAVSDFFDNPRSLYRQRWERTIVRMNDPNATGPMFELPSSQPMQKTTRFVELAITRFAEIDNLDTPGNADFFMRAKVAGQSYISGVINNHDVFSFKPPNAPYRFIKAVPPSATAPTPVRTLRVRIRTGDVSGGGTDDDVYLRINDQTRFNLDKRLFDDFERGDNHTYSVPIDAAIAGGLTIGDIKYLQIEKSRDGIAGAWRLNQAEIWINGQRVVLNNAVNRWLARSTRTWRSGYRALDPVGAAVPVFLQLWEMDAPLRGDNDHVDIHQWDRRKDTVVTYTPGTPPRTGRERGASLDKGRLGDGERGSMDWRLSTITPEPGPIFDTPPPPPPPLPPDLVITSHGFAMFASQVVLTIQNAGIGPAGPFLVTANGGLGTVQVPGLAAGASTTLSWNWTFCAGTHTATVDSFNQVAETNEGNNFSSFDAIC